MTKSERKKVNKANAAKSTGPKTAEGKQKSRLNSLVHGYNAKSIDVLIPDPKERAARLGVWNEAFSPANPGEETQVAEAAIAEYKLHAAMLAHSGVVTKQLKALDERWDLERFNRLDDLVKQLRITPGRTLRELGTFALGAEWVRDSWLELQRAFNAHGRWVTNDLIERALRLSGFQPDELKEASSTEGFALFVLAYSCWDPIDWEVATEPGEELLQMYHDRMPTVWRGTSPLIRTPDQAKAKVDLANLIAKEVAHWEEKFEEATASENLDYTCDRARAHVPLDSPDNKLLLRYTSAASTALNRAMNALQKAERERARQAEKAEKRNEPKPTKKPPLDPDTGKSYVTIGGETFATHPIGGGRFELIPVSRTGAGYVRHEGVVCDPVEIDPETGA